jgi:hypothetical protein
MSKNMTERDEMMQYREFIIVAAKWNISDHKVSTA